MFISRAMLAFVGMLSGQFTASAQPASSFYAGKSIDLIVSTGAGGPYDIAARAIANHMPRQIPGKPTIVVRNMPGAGNMRATNFLFNQASRDGLTFGTVVNSIGVHQAIGGQGAMYDARRFGWIGAIGQSNLTLFVTRKSGASVFEDARKMELTLGATGVGSGTFIYANAMNQVLNTRFKIIAGYKSLPEIDLAIVRGEVQGRGGGSYLSIVQEHPDWIKKNEIVFLAQIGLQREADLASVPLMHELATTEDARRILKFISSPVTAGRPFITPPDVPADRLALLRQSFAATLADSAYLEDAKKLGMDLPPLTGAQLEEVMLETLDTPEPLLKLAKSLIEP